MMTFQSIMSESVEDEESKIMCNTITNFFRKDMRSSNRSCTESAQDNDMGVNDDSIPEMSEELEEENESEEEEDERGGVVTHWDNEGVKVKSIESLVRHGSHNEASKSPQDSQAGHQYGSRFISCDYITFSFV